jgi:hypothetical protein
VKNQELNTGYKIIKPEKQKKVRWFTVTVVSLAATLMDLDNLRKSSVHISKQRYTCSEEVLMGKENKVTHTILMENCIPHKRGSK